MPFSLSGTQTSVTVSRLIQFLDGVAIESGAEESGVTPREIVATLPEKTRCFTPARKFMEVMNEIATWGDVDIVLRTLDSVVEFTACLPRGELKHGYFYWLGDKKIRGHVRYDRRGDIAFVERAFMGRPSVFMLFFNRDGGIMFKIFVTRGENDASRRNQLKAFRALARRIGRPFRGSAGSRP